MGPSATTLEAGRELDALLAVRVMGWQWFPYFMDPGKEHYRVCPPGPVHVGTIAEPPTFSTDIAAAWSLLMELGGNFNLLRRGSSEWIATLGDRHWSAETAPLAICRAVVGWVCIEGKGADAA